MQLNMGTILTVLEALNRAYHDALAVASEAATLAGPADQVALQDHLRVIQSENDAGHLALQAKLSELMGGKQNG